MLTNEIVRDTVSAKSESSKDEIIISIPEDQHDDERRDQDYYFKKLYQAASTDDWSTASEIYEKYPHYIAAKISEKGDTALHIAVEAENSSTFVLNLVDRMSPKDLVIKNRAGNTAFFLAAASGKLEFAMVMLKKNRELPLSLNGIFQYPIKIAAESGHKEMVQLIYDSMKHLDLKPYQLDIMFRSLVRVDAEMIKILYQAAFKGDWSTAKNIYEKYPIYISAMISAEGDTALHLAAKADSSVFVLQLVEKMNKEDLAIRNKDGNTAFCFVAKSGNLKLAKAMLTKNFDLLLIHGKSRKYPIEMAAEWGHKEMVKFLYDSTKHHDLHPSYYDDVMLHMLTINGFYDDALHLLRKRPDLASCRYGYRDETALHILARKPMMSSILANQNQEGISKRSFNLCSKLAVSGGNKFRHVKPQPQASELIKCLWNEVKHLDSDWISEVIFIAAREGNIEFLTIIIRDYPELIVKLNRENYSIFHVAVLNRQKDIFKLIYEIGPSNQHTILQHKDDNNNNILHLAGMLAPPHRLNSISGVALQLQQELLWFEEVSKLVHPSFAEAENRDGKTPRALFTEMHADLKEKGERWMKDTANSCMIVATLIATVVFAAAFTVPGGTKEDSGTPHFIQRVSFIIFVISDAVSLVSSSCSILTFLSILTSRYADEDFHSELPGKLVVGLSTLFLSISAMMAVFCATIFIVFKDGMIWYPILVSVLAALPVILFTKHQRRLLFDVARSTFKVSSVFQSSEYTLFDDQKAEKPTKGKDLGSDSLCDVAASTSMH